MKLMDFYFILASHGYARGVGLASATANPGRYRNSMDFADSGAQPNEQHAMSEHKTIFALARVERASVTRDQDPPERRGGTAGAVDA